MATATRSDPMTAENLQRAALLLAGLLSVNCALAHHSYAQFDRCKVSTIEGEVLSADYANPHIVLSVATDDGETFRIEWMSLQQLVRSHLEPEVVAAGDRVEITGARHRDTSIKLMTLLTEIRRPRDDWAWSRDRQRPVSCTK
jgi:hypothetical protein